jgi:membrane-associated phospholipid phosphatase
MMKRSAWSLLLLLCVQLPANAAQIKTPTEYLDDARDYFVSPLHWDAAQWRLAGAAAAIIVASSALDKPVRDHFAPRGTYPDNISPTRDALPLAALLVGTFAAGAVSHDHMLLGTGWDMGEAVVLGGLSSQGLKLISGRERPNEATKPSRFGHGGSSFPSGHTTIAFAAAQVLSDELPPDQWAWRTVAYGLATATAYARLDSNAHWLSDTAAGAALGMATGRFVSNRDIDRNAGLVMGVKPLHRGAMVTFALQVP